MAPKNNKNTKNIKRNQSNQKIRFVSKGGQMKESKLFRNILGYHIQSFQFVSVPS